MTIAKHVLFILLGIVLTYTSLGTALLFDPTVTTSYLEIAAVAVSFTCTVLFMLQKRVAYHYGVVSTVLLCLLFTTQQIYALAIFNGVLALSLVYGYFKWGSDDSSIPVSRTTLKGWTGYVLFFVLVALLGKWMLGEVSSVDLFLASGSAMAQLMLDNKKVENWLVWIVINIFSVVFFWQQGLVLMSIQFALFGVNAIVALFRWNKELKGV